MSAASSASHAPADGSQRAKKLATAVGVRLVRETKATATRSLEARRSQAEAYFSDAGRVIDAAANQFARDDHELTAQYVRTLARQSRQLGNLVDPKGLRAMVETAEDFIRRRPVTSTIAAFALVLATVQVIRAVPEESAPKPKGNGR